jgi:hypothetical protein
VNKLHSEQQRLHFVNTACCLGANAFRPSYFDAAAKRQTVWFGSEKPAAYILAINVDGSRDEWRVVITHQVSLAAAAHVRNGSKADVQPQVRFGWKAELSASGYSVFLPRRVARRLSQSSQLLSRAPYDGQVVKRAHSTSGFGNNRLDRGHVAAPETFFVVRQPLSDLKLTLAK